MKANLKHSLILWLLLHACLFTLGQQAYKAPLSKPGKDGFYNIVLQPELVAKCNRDLSDIRIVDENGKFIPYIIKTEQPVFNKEDFIEFPIVSNKKIKDSISEIIVEKKSPGVVSSLLLLVKNAEAIRMATLSGSNNGKDWYIIKENIMLEQENSDITDEHIQRLSFPLSQYTFFKINIHDRHLLPLNILKAGISVSKINQGKYLNVPSPALSEKDSGRHSYITIQFNDAYSVNKLQINTKSPALYKRHFQLNIDTGGFKSFITNGILEPGNNAVILNDCKASRLLLNVNNEDDEPLSISSVNAFQLQLYIVAQFKQGSSYYIECGDKNALSPQYDLRYFEDSIAITSHEEITAGMLQAIPAAAINSTAKGISGIWIWIAIGIVLILLLLLSMKLIKEVPQNR